MKIIGCMEGVEDKNWANGRGGLKKLPSSAGGLTD